MLKELLDILLCPAPECQKPIGEVPGDANSLRCTGCGRVYPVVNGIPVMLVERAK